MTTSWKEDKHSGWVGLSLFKDRESKKGFWYTLSESFDRNVGKLSWTF